MEPVKKSATDKFATKSIGAERKRFSGFLYMATHNIPFPAIVINDMTTREMPETREKVASISL